MKLTPEYIFEHLDEYYTDTYETIKYNGGTFKNSKWNHVHGGWKSGIGIPKIKKDIYAIMPYFDSDGTIRCNKVIKGFITEWFQSKDKENFIFTSLDIVGPYNKYYGRSIPLIIPEDNGMYGRKEYLKHFMMFDDIKEAKAALKNIVKDNEKTTLENQLKILDKEINDIQYELNRKIEVKENLTKKLNSL